MLIVHGVQQLCPPETKLFFNRHVVLHHLCSWTLGLRWENITLRNSFLRKMTRAISCIHATRVQAFHLLTPFIQHCRTGLEATMALSSSGVARMHGSTLPSSDLITWNTLVMMKLRWLDDIPRKWIDITTNSLETWAARDQLSQFQNDNRRGYARVTPVALSSVGVPGSNALPVDEYPKRGLGIYDDYETSH